jgi:type IV secretory pathway component VirB8
MKKSIIIYADWEEDVKLMSPEEAQNFLLNIFRNAKGEQPYLSSRAEQMHWLQIKRILEINKEKYEKRAARSRENGAKGGRPNNPTGYEETQ